MNIFKKKSTRRMRKIPEDLVLKPEIEVITSVRNDECRKAKYKAFVKYGPILNKETT